MWQRPHVAPRPKPLNVWPFAGDTAPPAQGGPFLRREREAPTHRGGWYAHALQKTSWAKCLVQMLAQRAFKIPTCPSRVKNLYTTEGFPWTDSPTLSPSDIL